MSIYVVVKESDSENLDEAINIEEFETDAQAATRIAAICEAHPEVPAEDMIVAVFDGQKLGLNIETKTKVRFVPDFS
jgi:hypothetical protein